MDSFVENSIDYLCSVIKTTIKEINSNFLENTRDDEEFNIAKEVFKKWKKEREECFLASLSKLPNNQQAFLEINYRYSFLLDELDFVYPVDLVSFLYSLEKVILNWSEDSERD